MRKPLRPLARRIVLQHAYAERLRVTHDPRTDIAYANHPECFVTQMEFPPMSQFHHRRDDVFGHGIGITALRAGKTNSLLRKILPINVVKPDRRGGNKLHTAGAQQPGVHRRNRPHQQDIRIAHRIGSDVASGYQPHLAQWAERLLREGDIWIGEDFHVQQWGELSNDFGV